MLDRLDRPGAIRVPVAAVQLQLGIGLRVRTASKLQQQCLFLALQAFLSALDRLARLVLVLERLGDLGGKLTVAILDHLAHGRGLVVPIGAHLSISGPGVPRNVHRSAKSSGPIVTTGRAMPLIVVASPLRPNTSRPSLADATALKR